MVAPRLAPSLVNLRREIDSQWPHRAHRIDGWYADPRQRTSYGHNPDPQGWVHAIDVDKNGINPMWIINHIYRGGGVLWYIIWNRQLWGADFGWIPYAYHGPSPHTDHMHFEVRHTPSARSYSGLWQIYDPGHGTFGDAPPATEWGVADYYPEIKSVADYVRGTGDSAQAHGAAIANLRR